jgi:hypothetical protein
MRLKLFALAAVLAACSGPIYEPASPQGDPPSRQSIEENIPKVFTPSANPRDILVSAVRPAVEQGLFVWLVCVRARVTAADGRDAGFVTIAVFFQRQEMVLRRSAEPKDKCEGFEKPNAKVTTAN